MAITAASVISPNRSSTDASSYNTASGSPGANKLQLLAVHAINSAASNPAAPTISGAGLTWVEVASSLYDTGGSNRARVTLFRAMSASPGSGALTITFSETMTNCEWTWIEFDGVDTSGTNGSGAIVQSATNNATATSLSVTLAAFGDATNNVAYGCFAHQANEGNTAGSGFSMTFGATSQETFGASRVASLGSEWKTGEDTGVDMSWTTSALCGGIAVEVKMAAAGGDKTVIATRAGAVASAPTHVPAITAVATIAAAIASAGTHVVSTVPITTVVATAAGASASAVAPLPLISVNATVAAAVASSVPATPALTVVATAAGATGVGLAPTPAITAMAVAAGAVATGPTHVPKITVIATAAGAVASTTAPVVVVANPVNVTVIATPAVASAGVNHPCINQPLPEALDPDSLTFNALTPVSLTVAQATQDEITLTAATPVSITVTPATPDSLTFDPKSPPC